MLVFYWEGFFCMGIHQRNCSVVFFCACDYGQKKKFHKIPLLHFGNSLNAAIFPLDVLFNWALKPWVPTLLFEERKLMTVSFLLHVTFLLWSSSIDSTLATLNWKYYICHHFFSNVLVQSSYGCLMFFSFLWHNL